MKLVIQIPCYNEEKTIAQVIKSIPRKIVKIKKIETLLIDDCSTDDSIKEAQKAGVNHIIINKRNLGLAKTFNLGVQKSLSLGADIIVNTDADNQYNQQEIPKLILPIINKEADIVIGNRQINQLPHMPIQKKLGNALGSSIIKFLSKTNITDASSGFRAFTREAASSFSLFSNHTYTHETIIQAAHNDFVLTEVPITFKKRPSGKSRLINNVIIHTFNSSKIIIRTILMYHAVKYLSTIGLLFILLGLTGTTRFLALYFTGNGAGHVQSLVISSISIGIGFNAILLGLIADLISINRRLIKKTHHD